MFREIVLHGAKILSLVTAMMSTIIVVTRARASFGRPWESRTQARNFERELVARKANNESQFRMPIAR